MRLNYRFFRPNILFTGIALVFAMFAFSLTATQRREPAPPPSGPVPMPVGLSSLRVLLGIKDSNPSEWEAEFKLSEGKVHRITEEEQAQPAQTLARRRLSSRRLRQGNQETMQAAALLVDLDAPATAKIQVLTNRGNFTFTLRDLKLGVPALFLDGSASVEKAPAIHQLTPEPTEDDFPACAKAKDGSIWCAFVSYSRGTPIDAAAMRQGNFDSLVTRDHGDRIRVMKFDGKVWRAPLDVTDAGLDLWRPTVAVDGKSVVWIVWSQNVGGNWDLYARSYDDKASKWSEVQRLTTEPGADINVVATTSSSGIVWLAWQKWERNSFHIQARTLGAPIQKSASTRSESNEWSPSIAADSKGKIHIAFDSYARGNYDVFLWTVDENAFPQQTGPNPAATSFPTQPIAVSPRFEARVSIAVDSQDRVWIAYEDADPNWGKDFGSRWEGKQGVPFYIDRSVIVRRFSQGTLEQTQVDLKTDVTETMYPPSRRMRMSFPRLGIDPLGKLWLLFRRTALASGQGERWVSYATYYDGENWSPPAVLGNSTNLMDVRPAVVPLDKLGLLAVYAGDGRVQSTQSARDNNIFAGVLRVEEPVKSPALVAARAEGSGESVAPVHPAESDDIRRIRDYRAAIGGKTYQLLRGEFHRHTEISSHRDQDGPFEEIFRYGLDVARMDWIGPGDHDNGVGREYTWWLTQKQVDLYYHAPTFMPMFTYERSVVYPSGHRNVMFARRGIRPLPRIATPQQREQLFGTPEGGSPDVKILYAYLRHFEGICSSHTSATNMGTDWRDNDPVVEPVVEIYQGHRQNYEEPAAPMAAKNAPDSIGGYEPLGFVWNAFTKGYKLGFQVSSDHVSTHISYAIVYAEGTSRDAILQAFKKRHSYGAHDNIILDVRCGEKMMGDEFELSAHPKLDIAVQGTSPVARIDIVRQIDREIPAYVFSTDLKQQNVKLSWTDTAAKAGAQNMYYVRIRQEDGKMAWASPMWIRYTAPQR